MVITVTLLAVGAAGLVWTWRTRPQQRRTVVGVVAAGGLGFQALHVLEHVVQAGAWVAAPEQPPFLTPWATAGRDALALGGDIALGTEVLHLAGNVVFLVGLLAFGALVRGHAGSRTRRSLHLALVVQALHVAEHVALTATAATAGTAVGVTTVFGLLENGPALWTLRVNAHLTLNTIATVAAAVSVLAWSADIPRTSLRGGISRSGRWRWLRRAADDSPSSS